MFSGGAAGWGRGATLPGGRGLVPASCLPLGGQRVIVTFTAFALAAEHKWGGQEQEG